MFFLTLIITLMYGLFFTLSEYYSIPCQGVKDYIQIVKFWLLGEFATFGLMLVLISNKCVFALVFPLLTMTCTTMTYYRYNVKMVLTPQIIDLFLVNDIKTSLDAISLTLVFLIIIALILSIFIVRYRFTHIYLKHNYIYIIIGSLMILFADSFEIAANEFQMRMPFNIYYVTKEYLEDRKSVEAQRPSFAGKAKCDEDSLTIVFMIGESLRADHLSINGYGRLTTPNISKEKNVVSLPHIYSPYSLTHLSVPHLLTRSDVNHPDRAFTEKSFISLFKQAGFHSVWIANQEKISTIAYFMNECDTVVYANAAKSMNLYDAWLDADILPLLNHALKKNYNDQLIIIHTVGSHWFYNTHCTEHFRKYHPTADKRVISSNSVQEMINSYDNTILYSDWFWEKVIEKLRNRKALLFYISDHGESLGEDGYLTHGVDRPEQHYPACFIWYSDKYAYSYPDKVKELKKNKNKKYYSYMVFPSILSAANIQTPYIDESLNIFAHKKIKIVIR